MKHFWKANVYETQAILYFILGVLILHLGSHPWLGWWSIIWGWFTMIYTAIYTTNHKKEIDAEFES